jgi:hypothetical protein
MPDLAPDAIPIPEKLPRLCGICKQGEVVGLCRHCGQEFCELHRSKLNSFLCYDCLTDDKVRTQDEPLTEDDGEGGIVTHQGRHIRLIGEGWPNDLLLIAKLTEEELEQQIIGLQALLKLAVQTGDYARISIAARQFEHGERAHSKRRRLEERREALSQGVLSINSKRYRRQAASETTQAEKLAKQLGISVEQAQLVLKAVGK